MQAASAGVEIVTPAWVSECLTRKCIAVPSAASIIRTLGGAEPNECAFGVAKIAAAKSQRNEAQLLQDVEVILCGSFETKQARDIHALVKAAGGNVLTNAIAAKKLLSLSQNRKLICLCNAKTKISQVLEDAIRAHSDQVFVVDFKWLFDCISCAMILEMDNYPPTDSKAERLWQFTMQKQT
jgi:hypothetical protein